MQAQAQQRTVRAAVALVTCRSCIGHVQLLACCTRYFARDVWRVTFAQMRSVPRDGRGYDNGQGWRLGAPQLRVLARETYLREHPPGECRSVKGTWRQMCFLGFFSFVLRCRMLTISFQVGKRYWM